MAGRQRASVETIRVRMSQPDYAEAIQSAAAMGQTLDIWASDAIAHHVYRCDQLQAQHRYRADVVEAERTMNPTPLQHDERYQVTRPKPGITKPAGQGSGASRRSYGHD